MSKDTGSIHPTAASKSEQKVTPITDDQKDTTSGSHFQLKELYLKDVSFEAPHPPHQVFKESQEWKPKLNFDLNIGTEKLTEDHYEILLHVHLKATTQDDKPIYLVELQQAGVFQLVGFTEELIKRIASTTCPEILFPYVREAVSSLVTRGGFPQMLLPPMNFEAMYAQYLTQQKTEDAANTDFGQTESDMVKH